MIKVILPKIVTFRIRLTQLFIVAKLVIYLKRWVNRGRKL